MFCFASWSSHLIEELLDGLPALVEHLAGWEGERVPPPVEDVESGDQGEAGRQVKQQVVIQQQHLQATRQL